MGHKPKAMPCVNADTVSPNGIPQTNQASANALEAPTMADRHGAMRSTARQMASRTGGIDATSADSRMLPATGL